MRRRRLFLVLVVLLIGIAVPSPALAQYWPPAPTNIVRETAVDWFSASPQTTVEADVSQFDPEQIITDMTIDLKEGVTQLQIRIYLLKEKPVEVPAIGGVYHYFIIGVTEETYENMLHASIVFKVQKKWIDDKNIDPTSIQLQMYDANMWTRYPVEEFDEDEVFLYYKAELPELALFAISGAAKSVPFPWGLTAGIIILVTAIAVLLWHLRFGRYDSSSET